MPNKNTLREQRRIARTAKARKQRTTVALFTLLIIAAIGLIAFRAWSSQESTRKIAAATTTAQYATNTAVAGTQSVQDTAVASTAIALSAKQTAEYTPPAPMTFPGTPTDVITTTSGLKYKDVTVGTGTEAKTGSSVSVNYTGWLTTGAQFDSSVGKTPLDFALGTGQVIKGWDEGVVGMKVGGRRILIIPPDLGYGAGGSGSIPPNATLIFMVDLLSVK